METRPLTTILYQKVITWIDEHSIADGLKIAALFFLAGIASFAFIDIDVTMERLLTILAWKNAALPKTMVMYSFVFQWRRAWKMLKAMIYFLANQEEGDTLEGIPTVEVLDHLFTTKSFKRDDVKKKWGIAHDRAQALCEKMEEVGILVRGEKNARVLNPAFSRQDIASMLDGKMIAEELEPLFRKTEKGYTREPSAKEIESRLSPTPGFTGRKLEMA